MSSLDDFREFMFERTEPQTDGCWRWLRTHDRYGYGRTSWSRSSLIGVSVLAHRAMYHLLVGPVPDGLQLDHLCRNRGCVNPAHLEPVTNRENAMRGVSVTAINAVKTHCPQGHPYDDANTYVYDAPGHRRRCCRACNADAQRRRKARLKVAAS